MKQDILNIWEEVKNSYKTGGTKYFFHNLSCNLRNWNFEPRETLLQKIAYSFGVFLISPTGDFYYNFVTKSPFYDVKDIKRHWQYHPFPWIARDARKRIAETLK